MFRCWNTSLFIAFVISSSLLLRDKKASDNFLSSAGSLEAAVVMKPCPACLFSAL